MLDSQRLASHAVIKTLEGRNLTQTLSEIWLKNPHLSPQQKGMIQDLSYGVFRYYGELQALLDRLLNKPAKNKTVISLLLVALYQLRYTQAHEYAIVNHAVNASAKHGPGIKNLVNAILRNYLRQKETLPTEITYDDQARFNHPAWWVKQLKKQYPDRYTSILKAGNTHPPMTLRINKRKTTLAAYQACLNNNDIEHEITSDIALMLKKPVPVNKLPGFFEGLVSIQDLGAQQAASLLDLNTGMDVLDACAAPGGKSAHILETCDVGLVSLDNNPTRLKQIEENFSRLGLTGQLKIGDASKPETWWDGKPFHRILADVPCSASGVVRRHPDIKWLRRPEDIQKFSHQQLTILDALWKTLGSGGKLLYSTCSVFYEENSELIADFLINHEDATQLALNDKFQDGQLLPDDQHDGFFYALLQKK